MSDEPEILANYGNTAIVSMPGRRFPGCWIAADTLSAWLASLENTEDLQSEADDVSQQIRTLLTAYVRFRRANAHPIPFEWPQVESLSEGDGGYDT